MASDQGAWQIVPKAIKNASRVAREAVTHKVNPHIIANRPTMTKCVQAAQIDGKRGERSASIVSTGAYMPSRVLSNADLEKMVDTSDEWIHEPHRHPPSAASRGRRNSPRTMGARAASRRWQTGKGIDPKSIDLIIVGDLHARHRFPLHACYISTRSAPRAPRPMTCRRPAQASFTRWSRGGAVHRRRFV